MFGFKRDKKDKFFNRRRLAVFSILYSVVWGYTILIIDVLFDLESEKVGLYLAFIGTVGALPTWQYLKAVFERDKQDRGETDDTV